MNKLRLIFLVVSSIFPSAVRVLLLNLLGYKVSRKAKLKLLSIVLAEEIHIAAFAKIDSFVLIGNLKKFIMDENSAIQRFTYISGNYFFRINKRSMIGSRCIINLGAGNLEIGEYSAIAPRSSIYTHGTFLPATHGYPVKSLGVKIGDYCWIMQNTSISPGVSIGSNSIILPGSVIVKSIPENMVVFDTPVKRKSFPIYFFKKKLDDIELTNLIKEITINYLEKIKLTNIKLNYSLNDEFIFITYNKKKYYKIIFSNKIAVALPLNDKVTHIYFYFDFDLNIMKNKQTICYDFKRITKCYIKLPEILNKFDEYAFADYGLKFIHIN